MANGGEGSQHAGGADQDVELTPALVQGRAQLVQAVGLAQVQRHEGSVLACRGEDPVVQCFECALRASERHDMGAGFRQAESDGRADAARRAGDQGDTARERFC